MNDVDPTGTDWSGQEVDLVIADYFDMLRLELMAEPYVKSHRNSALQELTKRSKGSIEFKHQNISAVLQQLAIQWIPGYKPRVNFQRLLVDGVERYLELNRDHVALSDTLSYNYTGLAETDAIFFESPPSLVEIEREDVQVLERIVRKFDPASRDAKNRTLGKLGEERVLYSERSRLIADDRFDLAKKVKWVSEEIGDGAGYDILSFDSCGKERLLEVKTTSGHRTTPFYISENERLLSGERPNEFRLVRLYNFAQKPKGFELIPPLEESVLLKPVNYRASFAP